MSDEDFQWGPAIQKGAEAAEVAFGQGIGAAIATQLAATLFDKGGEDKFADAIKDLKVSIHEMIDQAFLDQDVAQLVGLGANLKAYLVTYAYNPNKADHELIAGVHLLLPGLLNAIAKKNSFEALTALVYGVNVFIQTLIARSIEFPTYRSEAKSNLIYYSDLIEKKCEAFRNQINDTVSPPETETLIWNIFEVKDALLQIKSERPFQPVTYANGFTYKLQVYFLDLHIPHMREETGQQVYPFRGIRNSQDLIGGAAYRQFTLEDIKGTNSYLEIEKNRREIMQKRIDNLNFLLEPTSKAISKWREISKAATEPVPTN
ncbi:hypothetical protein [Paenibacillus sp. P32E]|uniref:hypothetical protein n=1 Tax=Paenibacillus sp. P32E TaxID=1349434 RepID=UPI00093B95EF|nr:hypothetical protein [Paenibacillus sp. P32E]OKP84511.1 hypothetical protein A3848_24880 [Paenibacillus sp. P32E]